MSNAAVLDDEESPVSSSRRLRTAALIVLAALLVIAGAVVALNMARAKARWLTLPDDCPALPLPVAAQLRVDPLPVTPVVSATAGCRWAGAARLQTVVTRYDGTLLTDPDDAALDALGEVRLKMFRPVGPQSGSTIFGTAGVDFGNGAHDVVLVTAVGNARFVVDYVDSDEALGEPQRAPLRQVVDTLVSRLG
jgi:hypothetical protein